MAMMRFDKATDKKAPQRLKRRTDNRNPNGTRMSHKRINQSISHFSWTVQQTKSAKMSFMINWSNLNTPERMIK